MGRRNKLNRDQKRKQKLAKRAEREPIQPYTGNKYKTERYVEALMQAEVGIYEAYVISDRRLTDRQVVEGCYVLNLPGLGGADLVAEDKTADLALLRVYGARNLPEEKVEAYKETHGDKTAGRTEAALDADDVAWEETRVMLRERANQPDMPKPTRKSALNEAEEAALGPALFTNPGVY